MVKKIVLRQFPERLTEDLQRYVQEARALGADDAKIIASDDVIIDERVRFKCIYPKCGFYGTNLNCPPYSPPLAEVRGVLKKYNQGIIVKVEVPSDAIAGKAVADQRSGRAPYALKLFEIVSKIESKAFYDGYYLALGFAGASCKIFLCPDKECEGLKAGHPCANKLKARGSMESAGMDVYRMAAKVGWDIYPIGVSSIPSEIPCGNFIGLILIN